MGDGDSSPDSSGLWRRSWFWLAVAAIHLTLLALYYLPTPKPPLGDETMYLRAAQVVLESGRSELGSLWPPGYAWFLAPLVALGNGSLWAVQLVQTVLLLAAAWLLALLLERGLGDPRARSFAVLFTIAYPPLIGFAHYLWPEVLHLTAMLAALAVLLLGPPAISTAVAGGLLIALCLQSKVLLTILLPLLIAGLWRYWPAALRLRLLIVLSLTIALGILPTVTAQFRDFGRPMLASSGWFNAWVGLNDVSRGEFRHPVVAEEYPRYLRSARSAQARDLLARDKVVALIREQGVVATLGERLRIQYFRLLSRDSFLTLQLAGGAIWQRGDGYRAGANAAGHAVRWLAYLMWGSLLLLTAWGSVTFPYRRRPVGWWVLAFVLCQLGLFIVLHVKSRYRVQMLPGLIFFAAYAASWWRARLGESRRGSLSTSSVPVLSRVRLACAALLALALLVIAFAPVS